MLTKHTEHRNVQMHQACYYGHQNLLTVLIPPLFQHDHDACGNI